MDNTKSEIYSLKNISKNFKDFLNRIKDYGFFQRLFAWKLLKNEANDLLNTLDNLSDLINELSNNNEKLNDSLNNNEKLKTDLQEENNKNSTLREELAKLEATREDRKKSYESKMKEFDDMVTRVNEREKQKEKRNICGVIKINV